jgi:hypothetical protein
VLDVGDGASVSLGMLRFEGWVVGALAYVRDGGNLTVVGCVFRANVAATALVNLQQGRSSLLVSGGSVFESNEGSVVYAFKGCCVELRDSAFDANAASDGAVVRAYSSGDGGDAPFALVLANSTFARNRASGNGGVVSEAGTAVVAIRGCAFLSSTASGSGGALELSCSNASVANSTFVDNRATVRARAPAPCSRQAITPPRARAASRS